MSKKKNLVTKLFQHNECDIELYTISNSLGLAVDILNYGARITSIRIPTRHLLNPFEDVVLGYSSYADYLQDTDYMNAIIGRVANRIRNSQFSINGKKYTLPANEGIHHLHGGLQGFDSKIWRFSEFIEHSSYSGIKLALNSPHLDQGYPGNIKIDLSFVLTEDNRLVIKTYAASDSDTIISITNHNYWNFNGHADHYADISNHVLCIPTNLTCNIDEHGLPDGTFSNILNTDYDFYKPRKFHRDFLNQGGIDTNYCFHNSSESQSSAELYSPKTGLGVSITSDLPGLQCYTGNQMQNNYRGKFKRSYGPKYGICLEPQHYPDAINQCNFPSSLIRINETYEKTITMLFNDSYPIDLNT